MPEPKPTAAPPTASFAPEGVTHDWNLSPPGEPPTRTHTLGSTPGPGHPDRATDSNTEILRADVGETEGYPTIPGFRIESVLGRGGMGVVYRATDLTLDKCVALKVIDIRGGNVSVVRGRFEREVQTLAALEHTNVVPVYHAGYCDGRPYFTMKFIPGGPLSRHLHRFAGDPIACARLMAKVARGLHHAHERGVVHRDLKPLNILLGDGDEPLVADFSLAKWLESVFDPTPEDTGDEVGPRSGPDELHLTATGAVLGTRQYMAPEQTKPDAELSAACDIWALGVTLYELLGGHRPFPDDGSSDIYTRIRESDPPPLAGSVPSGVAAVAAKCLAKAPEDRYPTAAAVAEALEAWVAAEVAPGHAESPPAPGLAAERLGTRGWWVGAALIGVVLLIAAPASFMPGRPRTVVPPSKSIAEQLRNGESVTLLGPDGLPPAGTTAVPTCEGVLGKGAKGFTTLSSAAFAAVELSAEELPWPVKLRAEYAFVQSQTPTSTAGVYVGRKEHPATPTMHSLVQLVTLNSWRDVPESKAELTEKTSFELAVWDHSPRGTRTHYPPATQTTVIPIEPDPPLRWQAVEIEIRPEELRGSWNGRELPPLFGSRRADQKAIHCIEPQLRNWAMGKPEGKIPAIAPPYIGRGIGLCVFNATAAYRNVILEPLTP